MFLTTHAPIEDLNQSDHPHSPTCPPWEALSIQRVPLKDLSDSADVQPDLSLHWVYRPEGTFPCIAV